MSSPTRRPKSCCTLARRASVFGPGPGPRRPPDETTILRFRHLIERHRLGPKMLQVVNRHLASHGLKVHQGTTVDATLIAPPTSKKTSSESCAPEMAARGKGTSDNLGRRFTWGVDSRTKVVHSLSVTASVNIFIFTGIVEATGVARSELAGRGSRRVGANRPQRI